MAGSTVTVTRFELPTPVQQLVRDVSNIGAPIPEKYTRLPKNQPAGSEDSVSSVVPLMDSNIIDLNLLSASLSPENEQELQKLRSILSSWGCFQLVNHGLTSLMDQVRDISKEFFALPLEEKQKYARKFDSIQGYGGDTVTDALPINWNDRLHLQVYPLHQRNLKFWPQDLPNFRKTLDEYASEIRKVQEVILKTVAKLLNLEEHSFIKKLGENGVLFARFNYYPPCPCPDRVVGLGPHSDASVLTVLLQDSEVEGLQVLKNDQWFKVPIIPNALFVNVGDQLEIMSNGALKSVVHKVVTNSDRERRSVAIPCGASIGEEIGPLSELIDDERPPLYKNVNNYMNLYFQHIARGERPINAVKI